MPIILPAVLAVTLSAAPLPDLLPPVQKIEMLHGAFTLPAEIVVRMPETWAGPGGGYLWVIREVLKPLGQYRVGMGPDSATIMVSESADTSLPAEGYVLEVSDSGIVIQARKAGGVFSALATLAQLIEQGLVAGEQGGHRRVRVPACRIRDWPALADRVVHIDMTVQQYTGDYVRQLMRTLARYKVNVILMEYADMFPFRKHKGICRPEALTELDVAEIVRTALECNQEIVPFMQCLGHLDFVLHKPDYEKYGANHNRYMLCPSSREAVPLVRELVDEILAQHPGVRRINMGGDEVDRRVTGQCPACDAYLKDHTFSSLWVRHCKPVADHCRDKGVQPLFWSDMMLTYPEAMDELPRDIGWLVWDYSVVSDPTNALAHGARMAVLDQVSPAYRKYFGKGIGIDDAKRRGGLVAFGHVSGFKQQGFAAYPAPAARCAGDSFAMPRFQHHMNNIRIAFLKAADFGVSGAFVTSWSYRGSSQEVCLPEYACVAYGWNTSTPEIDKLMTVFFQQRYGIEGSSLAAAVLAATPIVPPSARAIPQLDDTRAGWIVTGQQQAAQLRQALSAGREKTIATSNAWREQMAGTLAEWERVAGRATRNREELHAWELSLRFLDHRLRLSAPLLQLAGIAYADAEATDEQIAAWTRAVREFDESRKQLRLAWTEFFRGAYTEHCLQVELYTRFIAEQEMIELVLADVAKKRSAATSQPQ